MPTSVLVDWLSFTVPIDTLSSIPPQFALRKCISRVRHVTTGLLPLSLDAQAFTEYTGRVPYDTRFTDAATGTSIFCGPHVGHLLVELSGRGCQSIRDAGQMADTLLSVVSHLTRLDVAVDMETQTDPRSFTKKHHGKRFQSMSQFTSRTGITSYVGSTKSDRFARVYRYKEPLPRHHLLRAEHVFRADWARRVGALIVSKGILAAAQYCQQVWGWRHAAWDLPESEGLLAAATQLDTRRPNKIRWLLTQVFPAMRKMADEGILDDLRGFVEEHLLRPYEEGRQETVPSDR